MPDDRRVSAEAGARISDAAASADVLIEQPCGGNGRCGKCRVRFVEGAPAPGEADRKAFAPDELANGWRLACQAVVEGPATVEVPAASRTASAKTFGGDQLLPPDFERAVVTQLLSLDRDAMDDQVSLIERLARAAGRSGIPLASHSVLKEIARLAAERADRIGAIWECDTLRAVGPADLEQYHFGVAVDMGTTTVAAALIDLRDGRVCAMDSTLNRQVRFGADVVSRITHAISNNDGTANLQEAAVETIVEVLDALCREAAVEPNRIVALSAVGNSTMEHLLIGVNPASLGMAPYVGAWRGERAVPAAHMKLGVHPKAHIWVAPMVRSNVGGDTVAGMLATGMDRDERLRLLIDLGTNAEVVLGSAKRRLACSTAAGPAFEGASIAQGMRAAPGAIGAFHIHPSGKINMRTIDDQKARGICGSGLIDLVAALLRAGAIDERGWLREPPDKSEPRAAAVVARMIKTDKNLNAFVVATAEEAENGKPILLTAGDVRQIQLVKGSIAAGVQILCGEMGVQPADLDEILIAGAFGNFVRKSSALAIGLVPPVAEEKVRFVGNAAGVGARMMLVDRDSRRRALALADSTEYVELAGRTDYQTAFATAMLF